MKKYLVTFFFTCLLFSLISLVIEISQKLGRITGKDAPLEGIIVDYFILFIPFINGMLWPIFSLIAVVFFTSRLAGNTEFVAMLSTGVSLNRLLVPYLVVGIFISSLHLFANHYIIPISNDQRLTFEYTYLRPDRIEGRTQDVHLFLNPDQKIFIRFYSRRDTVCRDIRIETFGGEGEIVEILKARTMRFLEPPNLWRIGDYEVRDLRHGQESYHLYSGEHIDTVLNLFPSDFTTYQKDREMMTSPQLMDYLEREASKGVGRSPLIVAEFHRRTADAFSIIIMTIIGFAVASRKVRGGVGLQLASGVVLGALFTFTSRFAITYAASPAANQLVSIWIPNLLFGIIAIYLLKKAQK